MATPENELPTSAIWKATQWRLLTPFAPILIGFSFKVISNRSLIGSGVASVLGKLPRL
jgi:hypothetical protein